MNPKRWSKMTGKRKWYHACAKFAAAHDISLDDVHALMRHGMLIKKGQHVRLKHNKTNVREAVNGCHGLDRFNGYKQHGYSDSYNMLLDSFRQLGAAAAQCINKLGEGLAQGTLVNDGKGKLTYTSPSGQTITVPVTNTAGLASVYKAPFNP